MLDIDVAHVGALQSNGCDKLRTLYIKFSGMINIQSSWVIFVRPIDAMGKLMDEQISKRCKCFWHIKCSKLPLTGNNHAPVTAQHETDNLKYDYRFEICIGTCILVYKLC